MNVNKLPDNLEYNWCENLFQCFSYEWNTYNYTLENLNLFIDILISFLEKRALQDKWEWKIVLSKHAYIYGIVRDVIIWLFKQNWLVVEWFDMDKQFALMKMINIRLSHLDKNDSVSKIQSYIQLNLSRVLKIGRWVKTNLKKSIDELSKEDIGEDKVQAHFVVKYVAREFVRKEFDIEIKRFKKSAKIEKLSIPQLKQIYDTVFSKFMATFAKDFWLENIGYLHKKKLKEYIYVVLMSDIRKERKLKSQKPRWPQQASLL